MLSDGFLENRYKGIPGVENESSGGYSARIRSGWVAPGLSDSSCGASNRITAPSSSTSLLAAKTWDQSLSSSLPLVSVGGTKTSIDLRVLDGAGLIQSSDTVETQASQTPSDGHKKQARPIK